ncbi:MAG: nucleotidyltransferase [Bacilli bacterium]|nr:nucleotidyltransferase [Bacilli bacterium]MBR0194101.1 nucleotidyltransferase [Bacilli bacterium]
MQLVILAAGMGSRFGGLKQMEKMDEAGNFLLDYSVHDAKLAGFTSVIFVIKKAFYQAFKDTIGKRVEKIIETHYAFQEMDDLPKGYKVPEGREKPWGTAHAIYAARDLIKEDFIIINGDDYYGQQTYQVAANYLRGLKSNKEGQYVNVAFKVANTMTENGSVKRGVCFYDKDLYLTKMIESSVERNAKGEVECTPLDGGDSFIVPDDQLVSMNLFAFSKDIIKRLDERFPAWLDKHGQTLKDEWLIPSVVSELVEEGKASLKLLSTPDVWFGVTYKEDKDFVVASLKKLVEKGLYKKGLY